MAVPPNVPTSFVPKTPISAVARAPQSGTNVLMLIGMIFIVLAVVASGGVFLYGKYLGGVITSKEEAITKAQSSIDQASVEEFIRLRNRFNAANGLLDEHVAFSQFLELLEKAALQNVRFSSLLYTKADNGDHHLEMSGVARSFNALAAQSNAFAKEPYVRSAIFSDINVLPEGSVTFSFSARLDSKLVNMKEPTQSEIDAALRSGVRATSTGSSTLPTTPPPAPASTSTATTSSNATSPLLQL